MKDYNVKIKRYLSFNKINLMKKLFLLFAAATLLIGVQSCKQNAEESAETEPVVTEDSDMKDTVDISVPPAVADTRDVKSPVEKGK